MLAANGRAIVRCQLLASEFYEALKRALRAPELSPVERWAVMAVRHSQRRFSYTTQALRQDLLRVRAQGLLKSLGVISARQSAQWQLKSVPCRTT